MGDTILDRSKRTIWAYINAKSRKTLFIISLVKSFVDGSSFLKMMLRKSLAKR